MKIKRKIILILTIIFILNLKTVKAETSTPPGANENSNKIFLSFYIETDFNILTDRNESTSVTIINVYIEAYEKINIWVYADINGTSNINYSCYNNNLNVFENGQVASVNKWNKVITLEEGVYGLTIYEQNYGNISEIYFESTAGTGGTPGGNEGGNNGVTIDFNELKPALEQIASNQNRIIESMDQANELKQELINAVAIIICVLGFITAILIVIIFASVWGNT